MSLINAVLVLFANFLYCLSFSCTLYFDICIHYKVITRKSLVTIHNHTIHLFNPFAHSLNSFLSGNHQSFLYLWVCSCLFVFFVVYFVLFLFLSFNIPHWVNSCSIYLSLSDFFHLRLYTQIPSMLFKMARFNYFVFIIEWYSIVYIVDTHLPYPLINRWKVRLFLYHSYCK